jgi:uncharacterized protein
VNPEASHEHPNARRPRPVVDPLTEPFWSAARHGALAIQRCSTCRRFQHPPLPQCAQCASADFAFEPVSGQGRVAAWTVMHEPKVQGFEDAVPYICVLVELVEQEGLLLATNLLDASYQDVIAGLAVSVTYETVDDDFCLPQFRPSGRDATKKGMEERR